MRIRSAAGPDLTAHWPHYKVIRDTIGALRGGPPVTRSELQVPRRSRGGAARQARRRRDHLGVSSAGTGSSACKRF
ncbi:hypothetical protein DXZ75_09680 [Streptomyces sp. AcE210]|nr:hypothetical protein DXZ75_09680 [Streptomyces sp. AcE210]